MQYGIINSGGKQIKVVPGESIWVEKLDAKIGDKYEFKNVSAINDGKILHIGSPLLKSAKVIATVEKQGKGPKVIIFRTKAKSNWSRKQGHRQPYTRLLIEKLVLK